MEDQAELEESAVCSKVGCRRAMETFSCTPPSRLPSICWIASSAESIFSKVTNAQLKRQERRQFEHVLLHLVTTSHVRIISAEPNSQTPLLWLHLQVDDLSDFGERPSHHLLLHAVSVDVDCVSSLWSLQIPPNAPLEAPVSLPRLTLPPLASLVVSLAAFHSCFIVTTTMHQIEIIGLSLQTFFQKVTKRRRFEIRNTHVLWSSRNCRTDSSSSLPAEAEMKEGQVEPYNTSKNGMLNLQVK